MAQHKFTGANAIMGEHYLPGGRSDVGAPCLSTPFPQFRTAIQAGKFYAVKSGPPPNFA